MRLTLPDFCAARHPVDGYPIIIKRGEAGYAKWPADLVSPDEYNKANDIDEAVIETMVSCSMSGRWDKADIVAMRRSMERGRERVASGVRREQRPRGRWSED